MPITDFFVDQVYPRNESAQPYITPPRSTPVAVEEDHSLKGRFISECEELAYWLQHGSPGESYWIYPKQPNPFASFALSLGGRSSETSKVTNYTPETLEATVGAASLATFAFGKQLVGASKLLTGIGILGGVLLADSILGFAISEDATSILGNAWRALTK